MLKQTYKLVRDYTGTLEEIVNLKPKDDAVDLDDVIANMKELAFIVETVAHLQGKEDTLLPVANRARQLIAKLGA
jgi:hypothetical protein